jgi:acid phosphatase type 7
MAPFSAADHAARNVRLRRRRLAVLAGAALAVGAIAAVVALLLGGGHGGERRVAAPRVRTVTLTPAADASVFAAAPTANHGGSRTLRVDGAPVVRSYVRFDFAGLTGRRVSARLSLNPLTSNPVGLVVRLAPGGWAEHRITYASAPPPGPRIGLSGPVSPGVRVSIDVTRFVRGRRELDLALAGTSSQQIALADREQGGFGPRLIVTLKAPGRPAGSPAPGGVTARRVRNPLIAAAGDIACDPSSANYNGGAGTGNSCHARVVSDLLLRIRPAAVLPLGDDQYECGDVSGFRISYAESWGRLRSISRPVPGNHEYGEACGRSSADGYFRYFGAVAGPFGRGYYSYDLGSWHMIALNSECSSGRGRERVGGCQAGSPQERWLRRDLAAHRQLCTLAYWHEPRFSSGEHGDAQQTARIWNDLVRAHADIVLSGHNHDYERFTPLGAVSRVPVATGPTKPPNFQDPVPSAGGIREFVVGTGGKNHYRFSHPPLRGEVVRNSDTYGLLLLRLRRNGYGWHFVPEPGKTFTDSGRGRCH